MRLWATILGTSGSRVLAMLLGLVTVPFSTRLIGPEGRGAIAALHAWTSMLGVTLYLSLGQAMLKQAVAEGSRERFGTHAGSLLFLTAATSLLGWLAAALLLGSGAWRTAEGLPTLWILLSFVLLPFLIWEQHTTYLLMSLERLDVANQAMLGGRIASSTVSVGLLIGGVGPLAIILGNIAGQLVSLGVIWPTVRAASQNRLRLDWPAIRSLLQDGCKLHVGALATYVVNHFGLVVLSTRASLSEVGHYQLAMQVIAMMQSLPQAASWVMHGRQITLGPDASWGIQRRVVVNMLGGLVLICCLAYALAPQAIHLLAGPGFQPSSHYFRALLAPFLLLAIGTLINNQWIGRGWFLQLSTVNVVGGAINLAVCLWLVPTRGAEGCIMATTVSAALVATVHAVVGTRLEYEWRKSSRSTSQPSSVST